MFDGISDIRQRVPQAGTKKANSQENSSGGAETAGIQRLAVCTFFISDRQLRGYVRKRLPGGEIPVSRRVTPREFEAFDGSAARSGHGDSANSPPHVFILKTFAEKTQKTHARQIASQTS